MKKIILFNSGLIALIFSVWLIRVITFEYQLRQIHNKRCLIKNGMTVTEVYKIFDSNIKPHTYIKLNRDSTYSHRVYYPPLFNSEVPLSFDFNPFTLEVINYGECDPTR